MDFVAEGESAEPVAPVPKPPLALAVGSVRDPAEADADRLAAAALAKVDLAPSAHPSFPSGTGRIRRSATSGPPATPGEGGPLSTETGRAIGRIRSSGRQMPSSIREPLESAFDADFGAVRVHTGAAVDRVSRSMSASAFTTGSDVFLAAGAYDESAGPRQEVLAHELGHVVQNRRGKIQRRTDLTTIRRFDERTALQEMDAGRMGGAKGQAATLVAHDVGWKGRKQLPAELVNLRARAKALDLSGLNPVQAAIRLKAIASDVLGASRATKDNVATQRACVKILHILVAKIPAYFDEVSKSIDDVDPLQVIIDSGIRNVVNAVEAKSSSDDQNDSSNSGDGEDEDDFDDLLDLDDTTGYHGTSSGLLDGLMKSGGKLLSQKRAFESGLLKTGEGSTFSSGAGMKSNVYVGTGPAGLGTASAYALAGRKLTTYNPQLYTSAELDDAIKQCEIALDRERAVGLSAPETKDQLVLGKLNMKMQPTLQAELGDDVQTPGQNANQLKERLSKLRDERHRRDELGDEDDSTASASFPIIFQFKTARLTVTPDTGRLQPTSADPKSAGDDWRLAGEGTVANEIDLKQTIEKAYCPAANVKSLKTRLKAILGFDVDVIAMETLEQVLAGDTGAAKRSVTATFNHISSNQKALDFMLTAQKMAGVSLPDTIYGGADGSTKYEKMPLGGGRFALVAKEGRAVTDFETAGAAFEERLGAYAFSHDAAEAAAKTLARRATVFMDAHVKKRQLLQAEVKPGDVEDAEWRRLGETATVMAGGVGNAAADIKAVFASGNVRERLTHIVKFAHHLLPRLAKESDEGIEDFLKLARKNKTRLKKARKSVDGDAKQKGKRKKPRKAKIDQDARGRLLETRTNTRVKVGGGQAAKSTRTAGDVPGLSGREKKFMSIGGDADTVGWSEGAKVWAANELNEWVMANRAMGMPVTAGPSGHTDILMNAARTLGCEGVSFMRNLRLAIIGHLLPIRAHSLVEVLDVAKVHGVGYTSGEKMYRDLKPVTETDLRAFVAVGGKFPDEIADEKEGDGG